MVKEDAFSPFTETEAVCRCGCGLIGWNGDGGGGGGRIKCQARLVHLAHLYLFHSMGAWVAVVALARRCWLRVLVQLVCRVMLRQQACLLLWGVAVVTLARRCWLQVLVQLVCRVMLRQQACLILWGLWHQRWGVVCCACTPGAHMGGRGSIDVAIYRVGRRQGCASVCSPAAASLCHLPPSPVLWALRIQGVHCHLSPTVLTLLFRAPEFREALPKINNYFINLFN